MGLLRSLKKAVKRDFRGLKALATGNFKEFKGVVKERIGVIGKALNSKWGKAIMIAVAVFTLGTALIAGFGAASATTGGFMAKFVAGGKAFVGALANPYKAASQLASGSSAAGAAAGTAAAGSSAAAASAPIELLASGATAGQTAASAAAPAAAQAAAGAAAGAAAPAAAASSGGWLSNAAKAAGKGALEFAKSPAGGQVIGNMVQGYAQGEAQKEMLREQERRERFYDEQWRDPAKLGQLRDAVGGATQVPGGYLSRARLVGDFLVGRPDRQAGDPNKVFGEYVTGRPLQTDPNTVPGGVLGMGG